MAFNGNFEHTLDAKHRLTVPSKFRTQLSGPVFLVKGVDRCISVYPEQTYSAMTEAALSGLNPFSPTARELKRFFFNASFDTELDAANRVMVPTPLLDYAGLSKEVVVCGSGECLEVWDRSRYAQNFEDVLTRIPDLAASLGNTS